MKVGVPTEIKNNEYRVGLVPAAVKQLVVEGHTVQLQRGCGEGVGFSDQDYSAAGAKLAATAEAIYAESDLIIKVKEPQPQECKMLRRGQTLFAYLHLAADPEQARALLASGATCIAYETVTDSSGGLPLLAPMSEVAGRLSVQAAAYHLQKAQGGSGVLLGGVPGVAPGKVLILGGGVVGTNAAMMAVGLGADVTILDRSLPRLRELDFAFGNKIQTAYSTDDALDCLSREADVVIGAVLIPGSAAPKLLRASHLKQMRAGSVVVDVAIDQGGCFETSRPTTYENPSYEVDGIIHYCVANMPGGVARTATLALNNAVLPFVRTIAAKGAEQALGDDSCLLQGLNVHRGLITHPAVAEALGMDYVTARDALAS